MKKAVFWICMVALVPASIWGHGVITAAMDKRNKGGAQPNVQPVDSNKYREKVKVFLHAIHRSGYDYYYRNFGGVTKESDQIQSELGM